MKVVHPYIRYIVSVFVLIAGFESVFAFSIVPGQSAAPKSFVPSEPYTLDSGKTGIVTRQPIAFASLPKGGTQEFLDQLKIQFPASKGWTFRAAEHDLQGVFAVTAYYVFFNGTWGGGGFAFNYIPAGTDPRAEGSTELHWIQRIVSNHKRRSQHGISENRIGYRAPGINEMRPDVPFYDVLPKGGKRLNAISLAVPPHFEYDIGRNDPENDHAWSSEVYLVSLNKNDPKTVTIHNGVMWGWQNNVDTEAPTTR